MAEIPSLSIGSRLGDCFTIQARIGEGSTGQVFVAQRDDGHDVAIKVLHERAAQDPLLVTRFHREAEIAKRIRSPYVARLLDSGKEVDGHLWIAFELLRGEGLDKRLRREGSLSFSEAAPIVADVLEGLRDAHGVHVVHRDIKPANMFIENVVLSRPGEAPQVTERTRIVDFGVSKMRSQGGPRRSEPSITAFDATLGNFAFMAPEQVRGSARVDERADLYAVGAVAFRALTGRLPFEGANVASLVALKIEREPPSLAHVTGEKWPAAIETFLAKVMARRRDERFESAEEALNEWSAVIRTVGQAAVALHARPARVALDDDEADLLSRTIPASS